MMHDIDLEVLLYGFEKEREAILEALNQEISDKIGTQSHILEVFPVNSMPIIGTIMDDVIKIQQDLRYKISISTMQSNRVLLIRYRIRRLERTFITGSLTYDESRLLR